MFNKYNYKKKTDIRDVIVPLMLWQSGRMVKKDWPCTAFIFTNECSAFHKNHLCEISMVHLSLR